MINIVELDPHSEFIERHTQGETVKQCQFENSFGRSGFCKTKKADKREKYNAISEMMNMSTLYLYIEIWEGERSDKTGKSECCQKTNKNQEGNLFAGLGF